MTNKQAFWLLMTPILFVGIWITIGVVSLVINPAPHEPTARKVYQDAYIKSGGIPDTNVNGKEWTCEK